LRFDIYIFYLRVLQIIFFFSGSKF